MKITVERNEKETSIRREWFVHTKEYLELCLYAMKYEIDQIVEVEDKALVIWIIVEAIKSWDSEFKWEQQQDVKKTKRKRKTRNLW